jgi:hypothetical protein
MYLINSKTGKPVEVTDEDLKGYESGEKPKRSSFGARPKSKDDQTVRPSKLPQGRPTKSQSTRRATLLSHSKNRSNRRISMPDGSYPNGSIRQPYCGAS